MNKSGFTLTIITALMMAVAIGTGALLSSLSPLEEAPPETSSSGSVIPDQENPPDSGDSSSGDENKPVPEPVKGGLKGGNADALKQGRLPGYEDHDTNANPEKFYYLINSTVEFAEPDAEGNIMVENTPGNICPMQLCYYMNDTDELIYVSPMLTPGTHVATDTLTARLKKGEYSVNAVISVYDETTNELKTTFHEEVTVIIKEKFLGIF